MYFSGSVINKTATDKIIKQLIFCCNTNGSIFSFPNNSFSYSIDHQNISCYYDTTNTVPQMLFGNRSVKYQLLAIGFFFFCWMSIEVIFTWKLSYRILPPRNSGERPRKLLWIPSRWQLCYWPNGKVTNKISWYIVKLSFI